ncbi:MAG: adenylate/guanylate cyclase domain-containing protein, partial [Spirochaetes bacterium]|nr:adenylate/guanylate cyclase domain-containing protein [Spirochaetota bacterium]
MPREFLELLGKGDLTEIGLGDHTSGAMTIMFSDIRGFTSLSETLAPEETFDFINMYFGKISPIVREYSGLVDKYLGDAIMAIFPRSPEDALRAALAMRERLAGLNGSRTEA